MLALRYIFIIVLTDRLANNSVNMFNSASANMFTSDWNNVFIGALACKFISDFANMITSALANMFTSD